MSRFRLYPTPAQEQALLGHCAHARFVWNLGFGIVGPQASRIRQDNRRWSSVLVPKVGWVKLRRTRAVPDAKSYRVTLKAGQWHIAFANAPEPIPAPGGGEIVGIDRGVTVTLSYSEGRMANAPKPLPIETLQRRLSRAKRGSNRRKQLRIQLGRLHARNGLRLKDWVEKESTRVARGFDLIRVEDLRINNMTRSVRGTIEQPGRNVAAKSGLNRSILRSGWGGLVERLEQKAPGRVEKINPAYTSLTCSKCGHRARESRESQALFLCVACGFRSNADVNAARNIAAGHAARGASKVEALNRGPLTARTG